MNQVFGIVFLCIFLQATLAIRRSFGTNNQEEEIIRLFPKLELHAHLHGSVRRSTIYEFLNAEQKQKFQDGLEIEPFELFPIVHQMVNSKQILERITQEMITDYMEENTIYLEIRTSPKPLADGTNAREYVTTLLDIIAKHNKQHGEKMLVKLILSINRNKKSSEANEVLQIASELSHYPSSQDKLIVGIDFSGNPLGGRFDDFSPYFDEARKLGFNTSIHSAEINELSESINGLQDETTFILNYKPDRLGHLLYPKQSHFDMLKELNEKGFPPLIEICPSTSYVLMNLQSFSDHPHIRKLMAMNYPFSINTDDFGIFDTTITSEILHMKHAIELSLNDILEMEENSIIYSFTSSSEKMMLKKHLWNQISLIKDSFKENTEIQSLQPVNKTVDGLDMSWLYVI